MVVQKMGPVVLHKHLDITGKYQVKHELTKQISYQQKFLDTTFIQNVKAPLLQGILILCLVFNPCKCYDLIIGAKF